MNPKKETAMSDDPRPITQGLLDALVLTPVADPGGGPKFLDVRVRGLPGLRVTLEIAAVQELRQALDIILGPQETPALAMLLRSYFEVYDRPCRSNGHWDHVDEYRALDTQLRRLVGAPDSKAAPSTLTT
jgi:hypothetical protein